jgi:hypothetical protein
MRFLNIQTLDAVYGGEFKFNHLSGGGNEHFGAVNLGGALDLGNDRGQLQLGGTAVYSGTPKEHRTPAITAVNITHKPNDQHSYGIALARDTRNQNLGDSFAIHYGLTW